MAYPREDIDRVRDATDLAELAAEVTKVKRSGRSTMAVCPFHQEKTPSLSIDAARGLYHCFGCGKSGDVFRWVQETQNTDFVGALELLARRAGIALTQDPEASKRRDRREELVRATETAVAFYLDRLKTGDDAGSARSYLRSRGYDGEVVDQFSIGYSPDSWDALTKHLNQAGISDDVMITAGLASRARTGRPVDRFRGRVMFPIYDVRGDAVGFGARVLDGDGPKYLNSPETPIYHKSRLLYGLNWAKSAMVTRSQAVVVEGYTDVIAMQLAGHPVAVATCGTALGTEHLDLLRRFTERVVLAFDADAAGAGAALRGFEQSMPGDLDLRVAVLPEGRDPADLVGDGDERSLIKAIEESQPLMQFRIEQELKGFDLEEPEARGRAVAAVGAVVALHPDPVARHEYSVMVARRTGVELPYVERTVAQARGGQPSQAPIPRPAPGPAGRASGQVKAEREMLRLLLANDSATRAMDLEAAWFTLPEHRSGFSFLTERLEGVAPGVPPDLGAWLGSGEGPEQELLAALALEDRPLANPDDLEKRLKRGAVERRIDDMKRQLESMSPESREYSTGLTELIALERERRKLGRAE
ncbi:MAG: DNA primase [Acidimicrobiia bacterium]|nr:DNA primase [Acidimicrobiia bacterium]